MYSLGIVRKYLPLMRTVQRTFRGDIQAQRQVVAAVRMSIAELINSQIPEEEVIREMDLTEQMMKANIAQVNYNEKIDSYSVKLTEEMVPSNGSVVDIKTPGDLIEEQTAQFDDFVGRHKVA
jgi:hypothetical protein